MSSEENPLERILWIDLPDDIDPDLGPFRLNPTIPLPIEADEDGRIDVSTVTWEKVIAACLLVLANRPSHDHADYYRDFLKALRPNLVEELSAAAGESLNQEDWTNAEDILLALRGLEPESPIHRHAVAVLYDRRADRERKTGDARIAENYENAAEAAYNDILSDAEAPGEAWYDAGRFRYRRGEFRRAAESLEAYLASETRDDRRSEAERLVRLCRDEGQADDLYTGAYSALNAGRVSEGIDMARRFRDDRPNGWPGWFLLGWGLRLAEQWTEAREALEGARDRGCRESDLYNELAICTRALGDFDAAVEALENALKRDPENIKIISNMAIVQTEKGEPAEARRWLQTALTLDPDDPICRKLMEEIGDV